MRTPQLEIACFNWESAVMAQDAGAHRIELCENYNAGGMSPSFELLSQVRDSIQIPIHVMVRPRPGNFCYVRHDLDELYDDILVFKMSVEGIVFGALTENKEVDEHILGKVMKLAGPMSVTFHRAIDLCPDPDRALEVLIGQGVQRVLTSGGKGKATDNLAQLRRLNERYGDKITIIPAGGIRARDLPLLTETGCHEFHSSAITGGGDLADKHEIVLMKRVLNNFMDLHSK